MSFVGKWFGFGRNPHYDDGVRAYERGDFEIAVESFKICIASDPEPATRDRAKNYLAGALGKQAREALQKSDPKTAVRLLKEATSVRPSFADLRRWLAYAMCLSGDFAEASSEVEAALKVNVHYGQALALRAALEMQLGDPDGALKSAELAAKNDRRLNSSVIEEAKAAVASGDKAKAFKLLRDWEPDPDASPESIVATADESMKKRRWHDAEFLYRRAVDDSPRYADLRVKHGQALLELNDLNAAESEFREAISLNERFAEAHALLGVTLRRQGDEEGSKQAFLTAIKFEPDQPIASNELHRLRN